MILNLRLNNIQSHDGTSFLLFKLVLVIDIINIILKFVLVVIALLCFQIFFFSFAQLFLVLFFNFL